MSIVRALALALMVVVSGGRPPDAQGAEPKAGVEAEKQAIRNLLERQVFAAVNAGNYEAVRAGLTDDWTYFTSTGRRLDFESWKEVVSPYSELFLEIADVRTRLSEDGSVAWSTFGGRVRGEVDGEVVDDRKVLYTAIFNRIEGEWKLRHLQQGTVSSQSAPDSGTRQAGAAPVGGQSPEAELQQLAEDYAKDPALTQAVTFGVRIDSAEWTVIAVPASGDEPARVAVTRGAPDVPAFVYVTDGKTFARIASGDLHALTAMAQARASDPTPMRIEPVNGLEMDANGRAAFLSVSFHFFTTGQPEIVPLGPAHALPVHGGEALPIYYAEHLRTSWYGVAPGQHINAEVSDQVNDFDSLFIVIHGGTARGRLGGQEMTLEDGQAILVPAGMTHEFWNPGKERATLLLIMFGENA